MHRVGKVYKYLGLTVAHADRSLEWPLQRAAYAADITYVVAHDLCWAYLEDNSATRDASEVVRVYIPDTYGISPWKMTPK